MDDSTYVITFRCGDSPPKQASNPFRELNDELAKVTAKKILQDYKAASGVLTVVNFKTGEAKTLGIIQGVEGE